MRIKLLYFCCNACFSTSACNKSHCSLSLGSLAWAFKELITAARSTWPVCGLPKYCTISGLGFLPCKRSKSSSPETARPKRLYSLFNNTLATSACQALSTAMACICGFTLPPYCCLNCATLCSTLVLNSSYLISSPSIDPTVFLDDPKNAVPC